MEAQFDGVGGVDGLSGAQSVAVSPDGGHVYVAGSYGTTRLAVFARDVATGALTFVEAAVRRRRWRRRARRCPVGGGEPRRGARLRGRL